MRSSPREEPLGLYGIEANGTPPSSRGVAVLFTMIVIAWILVPGAVAVGNRSPWWAGAVFVALIVAALIWLGMSRHLISIHVHRSDDGVLWLTGTTIRGGQVTALVSDIERINRRSSRQSAAGIELARQWSIGLGVHHNDAAAFVQRLGPDLPMGTKIKPVRLSPLSRFTKRFYDHSASPALPSSH